MSIAVISMIRNEAERYLESALDVWREFADEIIVYEDWSMDSTRGMLLSAGCKVVNPVQTKPAWGNEVAPRKALWQAALESKCDWLFWLDADMIPAGDPRDLQARDADAISFRLFDLWDWRALMYRADGRWQAHNNPRIWMIRNPTRQHDDWIWHDRGIHCGHTPINYVPSRVLLAPLEYSILHYGYAAERDRAAKADQYAGQETQMSPDEILHARSISDETYITFPLPFKPLWQLEHLRERESLLGHVCDNSKLSSTPTIVLSKV